MNGRRETPRMQNVGKLKDSNYDGNCTSRHCPSGTYEISGRLIFVEQSVPFQIHSSFTFCVMEWLCGCKCNGFVLFHADKSDMPICCSCQASNFLGVVSILASVLFSFSSAVCMLSYCLE